MSPEFTHLLVALSLVGANIALLAIVRNDVIKRRLRFTLWTTLLYLGLHAAGQFVPGIRQFDHQRESLERLLLALALISGAVSLLNPWFRQGVPDRLPSILQDSIVLAVFGGVAVGWFHEQLAITSAVGAAVIGFAAQDTLGNAFAGLAIQIDRPFSVGHWITVGAYEGLVTEITWRATKIRTKAGNLVVVPNNIVSKEAINNYSQPDVPTRIAVDVGASYDVPPNEVKAAILTAVSHAARVLPTPAPDVVLADFGPSALLFRVRFWIADFAHDERARDEVRTFIYYEFRRRGIEIPYPTQVEYARERVAEDRAALTARAARLISASPMLSVLPDEARVALAQSSLPRLHSAGERIVREGDAASSMFLIEDGRVDVLLGTGERVASIAAGGYFGEMSLLTGAPRSATVRAVSDCSLVEISAENFRAWVQRHPGVLADLAAAASVRQQELETARAGAVDEQDDDASLLKKMRAFFGL